VYPGVKFYWTGDTMHQSCYLRDVAARCYNLGRACFDLDVARQLNDLGDELLESASKLDGQDSLNSYLVLTTGGSLERPTK